MKPTETIKDPEALTLNATAKKKGKVREISPQSHDVSTRRESPFYVSELQPTVSEYSLCRSTP